MAEPTGAEDAPQARQKDPERIIGASIAGRYSVRKCIGQGGMGVVYLARQDALDRDVVLKVVRADGDDDSEARFQREARSLSRLSHPNVVQIYDHGHDVDTGLLYIGMEYVKGITLNRYLKQRGPLSVGEFRPIAEQMVAGVAEAHRIGLIHRDLKPSNVMLTAPDGGQMQAKLLDFGLSKLADGREALTRLNQVVGSALYMAPEQFKGPDVDCRVDIYAMGVIFYQMLSGNRPYQGDQPHQVLAQQLTAQHTPLAKALPAGSDVPLPLIELVERCLSADPDRRPADGRALQAELQLALSGTTGNLTEVTRQARSLASRTMDTTLNTPLPPQGTAAPDRSVRLGMYAGVGSIVLALGGLLVVVGLLVAIGLSVGGGTATGDVAAAPVDELTTFRQQGIDALRAGDLMQAEMMLDIARKKAGETSDVAALADIAKARRKAKQGGGLVVTSPTRGLPFQVEGGDRGTTPADLPDLAPGDYTIVLEPPGAAPTRVSVKVPGGKKVAVADGGI